MARMYPDQVKWEAGRDAERKVYEACERQLDNSYTVFHSVAWQARDREGRPRDGEADLLVAHPERGVLTVEVKGGGIWHDPRAGSWVSVDRQGRHHAIKDPFSQARTSKYALEDWFTASLGSREPRVNLGYAVAFPDIVPGEFPPGPDRPREITLYASDLGEVSRWVGACLAYWRGKASAKETAPGEKAVEVLMELLGKSWELRPALWGEFVQEQKQLLQLTEQQFMVLDALNRQRRAAICGCAGSGKTMLAAEKATRLARQGFKVLLTCFNKNLADDLCGRLKQHANLDIRHFHGLCYGLVQNAGLMPVMTDKKSFFKHELPELMMDAADKLGIRYDAIVVDEGQDFSDDWWLPLQTLLRDPDGGILFIFYDDNQHIYARHSTFPIQQPPYPLTVNCRNTQSIHQLVVRFYKAEGLPTSKGPVGRPVQIISYGDRAQLRPKLLETLSWLTRDQRVPADEITVLSPLTRGKSLLWGAYVPPGMPELTDQWPPPPGHVYCTTIHSFKGLEQSVIILAEIDRWPADASELDPLLYVGCSRARNHLIVLLPEDARAKVRTAFAAAGPSVRVREDGPAWYAERQST